MIAPDRDLPYLYTIPLLVLPLRDYLSHRSGLDRFGSVSRVSSTELQPLIASPRYDRLSTTLSWLGKNAKIEDPG